MNDARGMVPLRFDLSELVRRSVATLYSHLVTRPTGRAIRLGIESQILEMRAPCISILDFSNVVVLDYSCADETVARLVARFQAADRPGEAWFIARGLGDGHRETLEAVLDRHGLAIIAESRDRVELLGPVPPTERAGWSAVEQLGRGGAREIAPRLDALEPDATRVLDRLAERRLVLRLGEPPLYHALSAVLRAR